MDKKELRELSEALKEGSVTGQEFANEVFDLFQELKKDPAFVGLMEIENQIVENIKSGKPRLFGVDISKVKELLDG